MEPTLFQEFEAKLAVWLAQGYQVLADDIDGELRVTVHFVSRDGAVGSEREQEYWPMSAETVKLLTDNGIEISKALAGPRPWSGARPQER